MKRRSTFIPSPDVDYDPSEIKISHQKLSFAGLNAAREERITLGLKEIPKEIVEILQKSDDLRVRWVSEQEYQKSSPYLSTLPPGLHVHYTPLENSRDEGEELCSLLKRFFSPSLRCSTIDASFSRSHIILEQPTSTGPLQYYSLLPSIKTLVAYIQRNICPPTDVVCTHSAALLNIASYIDIDYDHISHALSLAVYWSKPPAVLVDPIGEWTTYDHWNLAIEQGPSSPSTRNELGVLRATPEPPPATSPGEIQMEGFLTVLGQDESPKGTLFSFQSRHQSLSPTQVESQQYTITFDTPTGLHPTMRITFPSLSSSTSSSAPQPPINAPPDSICTLNTYLLLPSVLFPDQYVFPTDPATPDPLFTSAHNIQILRHLSGELDLEIPDYVVHQWGSAMLLELSTTNNTQSTSPQPEYTVTIPLHLRYLPPSPTGYRKITVPHPTLFWACTLPTDSAVNFHVNPFDRVYLGYDSLFDANTIFYHLEPYRNSKVGAAGKTKLVSDIEVPVLNEGTLGFKGVEWVTGVSVLVGFLYVAVVVVRGILSGGGSASGKDKMAAQGKAKKLKKVQ